MKDNEYSPQEKNHLKASLLSPDTDNVSLANGIFKYKFTAKQVKEICKELNREQNKYRFTQYRKHVTRIPQLH